MSEGETSTQASAEAAAWLARLHSRDVPLDVLEDFYQWRRDATNAEAFSRAESFWKAAGELGRDSAVVGATMDALARSATPSRLRGLLQYLSRPRTIGVGAALCIAATSAVLWTERPLSVTTGIGEQRILLLQDGTRVRLNTSTRLTAWLGRHAREVTLDGGEAYFEVAHDAARPFSVRTGDLVVHDIGTRFDVRSDEAAVRVAVADGTVEVKARDAVETGTRLKAGDQLDIRNGAPPVRTSADLDQILSWIGGHVLFRDATLADAVAEMNRYSPYPIELQSIRLSGARVNGVFETGNSADFATAMSRLYSLKMVRKQDGSITLSD